MLELSEYYLLAAGFGLKETHLLKIFMLLLEGSMSLLQFLMDTLQPHQFSLQGGVEACNMVPWNTASEIMLERTFQNRFESVKVAASIKQRPSDSLHFHVRVHGPEIV